MSPFDKLITHFERFPGIGGRQAKRFVFHLLTLPPAEANEIAELIRTIHDTVVSCPLCFRFHTLKSPQGFCRVCSDPHRDRTKITIVERDNDIDAIERGGVYEGLYFVLGGTVPLLDSQDTKKLRGNTLKHYVDTNASGTALQEIILAFSVNPDGENTARYIEMLLREVSEKNNIRITHLGRGLSTGSELEYADSETIKNAFRNRG